MVKTYNKLVRNNILRTIEADGKQAHIIVLEQEDYLDALDVKLTEEVAEYIADGSEMELADILEVIDAIIIARGYDKSEIDALREEKKRTHGGFDQKIFLTEVISSKQA